jgi:hypothetical protein
MTEHTPTPWMVEATARAFYIAAGESELVGSTTIDDTGKANAEHIVRCVNLHDELVAALTGILESYVPRRDSDDPDVMAAQAALAKARGES